MADVSAVTDGYFPVAKEGFSTNTSSSVSAGAATVGLNSVAGFSNGDHVVLVIDPLDATKKQVFTGTVDTVGVQITGVKWTEGSSTSHSAGATVVDYETATHWSLYSKGMKKEHNTNGTHAAVTATSLTTSANVTVGGNLNVTGIVTIGGSGSTGGWDPLSGSVSAVTNNGSGSYDLTTSADQTGTLSPGMKLRTTRTVNAPTQCTSLNGTTQYWSKTTPGGLTFTDDFVAGAWIYLTSYPAAYGAIISRYNGTSGWQMGINSSGQVVLSGFNAGAGNNSNVTSYQSVPLNRWVHVAAQLDMSAFTATSTTSYVMINGSDVLATVSRAGTNPTALVQAGDLQIGASNSTTFFPGKISSAFVSSAKITQANVRLLNSQGITAALVATHSIASAFSFDNSVTDINTTSANNLSASGAATATNADSPYSKNSFNTPTGNLDYAYVQKVTASTVTVSVAEGCTIPTSGGVSAFSYAKLGTPYGFPDKGRFNLVYLWRTGSLGISAPGTLSWQATTGMQANEPTGMWRRSYSFLPYAARATAGTVSFATTLSETSAAEGDNLMSSLIYMNNVTEAAATQTKVSPATYSNTGSARTLYVNMRPAIAGLTATSVLATVGSFVDSTITLEPAFA